MRGNDDTETLRRRIVTSLVGIAGFLLGLAWKSTGQGGVALFVAALAVLVLAALFVM
jgi:hypothetical protein